jgi:hypothetical protein
MPVLAVDVDKMLWDYAPGLATPNALAKISADCGLTTIYLDRQYTVTLSGGNEVIYRTSRSRSIVYFLLLNYLNLAAGGSIIRGRVVLERRKKRKS